MRTAEPRARFAAHLPRVAAALTLAAGLAACAAEATSTGPATEPPPTGTTPPPSGAATRTPGYVTGTIVDAAGRPLAGVEVFADNTLYYNTNAIGYTDAQGRYKIDVRQPIGTWRMGAHLKRQFNGRTYQFDLHPDNAQAFPGADGAVRNFSWRLAGATPEGGWYGAQAYVYVNGSADGSLTPREEDVEVTFTPVGALADGSVGETGVVRLEGIRVNNIPLGRYAVSARYAPASGAPRPMVVRVRDAGAYATSVTADWPANSDGRPQTLEIETRLP